MLEIQAEEGTDRRLVGFEMIDRGIARHGCETFLSETDTDPAGTVTSGTQSPTFGKALGMAYLPTDQTEIGNKFFVQIRNRRLRARVVELPFYSRKKKIGSA